MEKNKLRLLVVEDEKKLCDMIAKSLHMAGYEEDMCVNLSQIQDIDFILDERARELAGEQLRWFDLKRFGKEQFVKRIKKCNPNAANVDEHHWVRPFPQTFLDAIENKTEFTQNTGYK